MFKKLALVGLLTLTANSAYAACDIAANANINIKINILGNEFPAIHTIAKQAQSCAGTGVSIKTNLTADHKNIQVAGLSGNPAEYSAAIVANSTIVPLMNEDLIRPLDDLIAKYGQTLKKNQLISIDGKVMAVAFMANAQHLVYRADILEKAGLSVPKTYEDMVAAAKVIREKGLLSNPLGGAYKAGWNLAQEFTNMYIGHGGQFFKSGTAEIDINNKKGVATLQMLKTLSTYMNPDFLTHDSNATSAEWKAGNVALMSMWGSRIGALSETEGATQAVRQHTKLAAPLLVANGDVPATTLWWDGWTIAKKIPDNLAEATFKSLVHGIRPEILTDETQTQAVWLIDGYQPTQASEGVFAAVKMGATPYPMKPYQGLLHTAIGAELSDFMQGKEDAKTALADIEAAYNAAAKEKGFK